MQSAHPYLIFAGNAEEAFNFYKSVFGGDFEMLVRFDRFSDGMGVQESDRQKIAHIALPIGGGVMLMASDVVGEQARSHQVGTNSYIMLAPSDASEAERVFDALAAGGQTEMPLQRTEWAEKYGSCADKFGVRWMVSYAGEVRFDG